MGHALIDLFRQEGYNMLVLSRRPDKHTDIPTNTVKFKQWDARNLNGWVKELDGASAVINLAGENLSSGFWTEKRKHKLLHSRIDATRAILEAIRKVGKPPEVMIQASAIGYYGSRGDEILDETSHRGEGFLADLCEQWERTAAEVEKLGVRLVRLRFGLVLGGNGGLLQRMTIPYQLFAGFHFGNNDQWMSWVHRHDVVNSILFAMQHKEMKGVANVTAPEPILFREFLQQLGKQLHRPSWLYIPPVLLRAFLGQMAEETIFTSQRIIPGKLMELGYSFAFSSIDLALRDILNS